MQPQGKATATALAFALGNRRLGLPVEAVHSIARAAAFEPVEPPQPPLLGMLNWHGTPIPVVGLHQHTGQRQPELHPGQRLIVCQNATHFVALLVDAVEGLIEIPEDCRRDNAAEKNNLNLIPDWLPAESIAAVKASHDGVIIIYSLESFLRGVPATQSQTNACKEAPAMEAAHD